MAQGTGGLLAATSSSCWVAGDETASCQLCVASVADDGTLALRLRMPDCLAEQHGKYLVIEGVRFAYGHEQVLAGLQSNAEYAAYRREHGEKAARATKLVPSHQLPVQAGCQGLAGVREHPDDGCAGGLRTGGAVPSAWI